MYFDRKKEENRIEKVLNIAIKSPFLEERKCAMETYNKILLKIKNKFGTNEYYYIVKKYRKEFCYMEIYGKKLENSDLLCFKCNRSSILECAECNKKYYNKKLVDILI